MRPFTSIRRMNSVLLNNWNNTVKKEDAVYFLGDLTFGKNSRPSEFWLRQLKGKIT